MGRHRDDEVASPTDVVNSDEAFERPRQPTEQLGPSAELGPEQE